MDVITSKEPGQISRRKFLKDSLLAVGLCLLTPMAFFNACKGTDKTSEETAMVPAKRVPDRLADTTNPPASQSTPSTIITQDIENLLFNYSLSVDGLVNTPLTLNYDSILQFPSVTKTVTLTCPGVFDETSEWTGVPLISILTACGVKSEATQVNIMDASGYAAPFSVQEQSVLSGDIFLAYKYNGQGLPADRGYPLRLVVPGREGTAWVKGVTHIRVAQ